MIKSLVARISAFLGSNNAEIALKAEIAELQRKLTDCQDQVTELYSVISDKDQAYEVLFQKMRFEMMMADQEVTLRKAVAAYHHDNSMQIWFVQGQNCTPAGAIPFTAYVSAKTEADAKKMIAGRVPNLGSQSVKAENVTEYYTADRLSWATNAPLTCDSQHGGWNIKTH